MFIDHKTVYHVSPYDNLAYPRAGGGDYGKAFYTADNEDGALYYAQSRSEKPLPDLISLNGQWISSNLLEDYFLSSQGILNENTSTRDKKSMPFIHALLEALRKKGGEATFSRAELEEILADTYRLYSDRWRNDTKLREAFFKKFANVPLKTKSAGKPNTSLYEVNIKGNFMQIYSLDQKVLTLADNGYHDLDTKTLYDIMKLDYSKKNPTRVVESARQLGYSLMLEYHFSKDKILNPLSDKEIQAVKSKSSFLDYATDHCLSALTNHNHKGTAERQFALMSDPSQNNMELGYRTFDLKGMNKVAEAETEKILQFTEKFMKYALLHLPIYKVIQDKNCYNLNVLNFDGMIDPGLTKNTYYYIIRHLKAATLTRIKNEKTNWKWQEVKKAPKPLDKRIMDVLGSNR